MGEDAQAQDVGVNVTELIRTDDGFRTFVVMSLHNQDQRTGRIEKRLGSLPCADSGNCAPQPRKDRVKQHAWTAGWATVIVSVVELVKSMLSHAARVLFVAALALAAGCASSPVAPAPTPPLPS